MLWDFRSLLYGLQLSVSYFSAFPHLQTQGTSHTQCQWLSEVSGAYPSPELLDICILNFSEFFEDFIKTCLCLILWASLWWDPVTIILKNSPLSNPADLSACNRLPRVRVVKNIRKHRRAQAHFPDPLSRKLLLPRGNMHVCLYLRYSKTEPMGDTILLTNRKTRKLA